MSAEHMSSQKCSVDTGGPEGKWGKGGQGTQDREEEGGKEGSDRDRV
jgi:hypothetical protein